MQTSILFVEDDRNSVEPIMSMIERDYNTVFRVDLLDFDEAPQYISERNPDIVVLDLMAGGTTSDPQGINIHNLVWNKHFCPVVVYSAYPDELPELKSEHPFLKKVQKGSGSAQEVIDIIKEFAPHVEALREAQTHIRQIFSMSIKELAPVVFREATELSKQKEMILRSGRRRLAALMDDFPGEENCLACWEQYLFPPIGNDLRLGDILRRREVDGRLNPTDFRVVLSPSCDLVASNGRESKISKILTAKCYDIKVALEHTSYKGKSGSKIKETIKRNMLTQGFFEAIVPFPSLEGHIPTMMAYLKEIEFIPFDSIGDDMDFIRISSIDSPFRELLSWAYMSTACRPGLPDRDFAAWSTEIMNKYNESGN